MTAGPTYSHLLFPCHQSFSLKRIEKQRFFSQATLQKPPVLAHLRLNSKVALVDPQKALAGPWVSRLLTSELRVELGPTMGRSDLIGEG